MNMLLLNAKLLLNIQTGVQSFLRVKSVAEGNLLYVLVGVVGMVFRYSDCEDEDIDNVIYYQFDFDDEP